MRSRLLCVTIGVGINSLLTACHSPQAMIQDTLHTASGTLTEAKERVDSVTQPIVHTAQDIQKRAQTVKEGIDEITAGQAKIKAGLTR